MIRRKKDAALSASNERVTRTVSPQVRMMHDLAPTRSFLFGWCPQCEAEQLAWLDVDPSWDQNPIVRCTRCDGLLQHPYREADLDDLDSVGLTCFEDTPPQTTGTAPLGCAGCRCRR